MGSSSKSSSTSSNAGANLAQMQYMRQYGPLAQPNPMTSILNNQQQDFYNRYTQAADRSTADYSDIMSGYQNWGKDVGGLESSIDSMSPTNFSFTPVNAERVSSPTPKELQESYGYLRETVPGYRDFANTGGYSEQDIADLRARGTSPVRAAYANAQANIERAKAIGGGYAPNYIAATAKMTRDQSQQASDAMQAVNAKLAEDIRTGKLAGLSGLSNVGSTMGGMSLQDAARILQADMANQSTDLQSQLANQRAGIDVQGMSEQSRQNKIANQMGVRSLGLQGLNARTGLYGTTPGQASMFGNQALQAMNQRLTAQGMDQDNAARLLGIMSGNQQEQKQSGPAWWTYALSAAPYVAMALSDKNAKEDIQPVDEKKILKGIKKLNLATWRYKGDPVTHMGPMAQDVKKHLGIGDGKTIHLADIMGVMLATSKEQAHA